MTTDYRRPDLSIDQQLALRTAATNLARRVRRHLRRRDHRTVPAHLLRRVRRPRRRAELPAAAGRAVRPPAPARAGPGRGQARRRHAGGAVPVHPQRRPLPDGARLLHPPRRRPRHRLVRRLRPGDEINPAAVAAMAERGIDISGEYPKPWTDEVVRAADVVITMGCGDACPVFPGRRYEDWVARRPRRAGPGRRAPDPRRDRTPRPRPARRASTCPPVPETAARAPSRRCAAGAAAARRVPRHRPARRRRRRLRHRRRNGCPPTTSACSCWRTRSTTVFGLGVLILLFGPVSGAHFNPVVSAVDWLLGRRAGTGLTGADVAAYTAAQIVGGDRRGACWPTSCSSCRAVQLSTTRPHRRWHCGSARSSPPPG